MRYINLPVRKKKREKDYEHLPTKTSNDNKMPTLRVPGSDHGSLSTKLILNEMQEGEEVGRYICCQMKS
jgi:hypothetical protein